jgi:hypothetical protein
MQPFIPANVRHWYDFDPLFLLLVTWSTLSSLCLLLRQSLLLCGLLCLECLGTVVLAHWLDNWLLLLWLDDGDGIWEGLGWARFAFWIRTTHNLDLDTEDTLAQQNVAGGVVDEVLGWLTGVDHETVLHNQLELNMFEGIKMRTYGEFHGLSTGSSQFTTDNDLTTLGTALHDESENTVACSSNSKTVEKLVSQ